MEAPVARRVERPGWLNLRTVLGVVLLVVAFVAGRAALEGADDTVAVWVAAHDLPQGEVLGASDLEVSKVRLPAAVMDGYETASRSLQGRTLTRAVRAGELIPVDAAVGSSSSTSSVMTVPVAPEHAVGGALNPGDRVDVLATFDAGQPGARTVVVSRGLQVQQVVASSGLISGGDSMIGITVSVPPQDVSRLAFALRSADIDVVKAAPGGDDDIPSQVDGGDL